MDKTKKKQIGMTIAAVLIIALLLYWLTMALIIDSDELALLR
jgi:hypothetical protein